MVMAEKQYPPSLGEQIVDDIKEFFGGKKEESPEAKPGSEQPAPGKCGCHPGGIHPINTPMEVEQQEEVKLHSIPVHVERVESIVNVRVMPAKRASMETFYPGTTPGTAVPIQKRDPKISRLILSVAAEAVWIGTEEQIKSMVAGGGGGTNSQAFLLAPNNICPAWEGVHEDLWAMAQNGGAILSIRREYWPDI